MTSNKKSGTGKTAKRAKTAPLPQFYKRPVALNARGHRHAGIQAHPGYGFAAAALSVPVHVNEFADAVRDYPIVFTDKGTPAPLAILGVEAGRNLFVDEDGAWKADTWLPLYVRRYPFIAVGTAGTAAMSLAIDMGSGLFAPRAVEGRDLPLFDADGQLALASLAGVELCSAWNEGVSMTTAFGNALVESGLLRPGRIELALAGGRKQVIDGYLEVNEAAFRALPAETVTLWHARGWLDLVTLHLASQRNWARLAGGPWPWN
jgi:hypothetical protein